MAQNEIVMQQVMNVYGLIGYPLTHSFSKKYFSEKFEREGIAYSSYELFPIEAINLLPPILEKHPNISGLNVTIPYKQAIIPYLDALDDNAAAIGAVNTVKVKDGKLKGYNTDAIGFQVSLMELLGNTDYRVIQALVLGNGGAAKAVIHVLKQLGITYQVVSRTTTSNTLAYEAITNEVLATHSLIINTTPLGMSPHYDTYPNLPYTALTPKHFLYDLVYNPEETLFLKYGVSHGAATMNGLKMLYLQAEAAWKIWNE